MRTSIVLSIILVFTGPTSYFALAQKHGITFSLQPNMLFNPGTYTHDNPNLPALIESRRVAGASLQVAYKRYFDERRFASVGFRLTRLRDGINPNVHQSGFNDLSRIKYSKGSGFTDIPFFRGVGLILQGGYIMPVSERSSFSIEPGIHLDFTSTTPKEFTTEYNMGDITNTGRDTYETVYFTTWTSKRSYFGFDLSLLYHLKSKSRRTEFFTGATVSIDPVEDLEGTYISYPSLATKNSGTFSISRNRFGCVIGLEINLDKETNY